MNNTAYCEPMQIEITGPKRRTRLFKARNEKDRRKHLQHLYSNLPREERRRLDYTRNEYAIVSAISNLLHQNGRFPTVLEIEQETMISRTTIYKHLKGVKDLEIATEHNQMVQKMRRLVVEKLYLIGTVGAGNVRALSEFLKWSHNSQMSKSNYLQINNTFIDQRTLQLLPTNIVNQIELLLNPMLKVDKG